MSDLNDYAPYSMRPVQQFADTFKRCLEECDIAGMRALWKHVSPNLPQPKTDQEALISIHIARTMSEAVLFKFRAYSHRWLIDNGYPTGLPDHLKPKAERLYPKIAEAVGIAALRPQPYTPLVQKAMANAVLEAYADKQTNPEYVKQRMHEARMKERKKLLG